MGLFTRRSAQVRRFQKFSFRKRRKLIGARKLINRAGRRFW